MPMILKNIFYSVLVVNLFWLTGCKDSVKEEITEQQKAATIEVQSACAKGECPCESELGLVPHGESAVFFKIAEVSCKETCESQQVKLTCNNGEFDQSLTGLQSKCEVKACDNCLVNGSIIPHAQNIEVFTKAEVGCNEMCSDFKAVNTCDNGQLKGAVAGSSFTCSKRSCKCLLPDNSSYMPYQTKRDFYSASQAACGQRCADLVQNRECTEVASGTSFIYKLSGGDTYSKTSCSEAINCKCALPGLLGYLNHNETKVIYSQERVTCGASCDNTPKITALCQNGVLKNQADSVPIDNASTTYKYVCKADECKVCNLAGYGTVISGWSSIAQNRSFFSKSSVTCLESCSDFKVNLECKDGVLLKDGVEYVYSSSTTPTYCNAVCKSCKLFDSSNQVPSGSYGVFFKIQSVNTAACSASCTSVKRLCKDGTWEGDPGYTNSICPQPSNCLSEGGGAPKQACLLPWSSAAVSPGAKITFYSKKLVTRPDSCANYMKVGTCAGENGLFDVPLSYIYHDCKEQ